LLEDETALNVMTASKAKSTEVNEKQEISDKTEIKIDAARQNYVKNSELASILYFVISDLGNIDPIYQYSLNYFFS
jgi:dynein heavy chain